MGEEYYWKEGKEVNSGSTEGGLGTQEAACVGRGTFRRG